MATSEFFLLNFTILDGERSIEPVEITLEIGHKLRVILLLIGNVEHVHVAGDLLLSQLSLVREWMSLSFSSSLLVRK